MRAWLRGNQMGDTASRKGESNSQNAMPILLEDFREVRFLFTKAFRRPLECQRT